MHIFTDVFTPNKVCIKQILPLKQVSNTKPIFEWCKFCLNQGYYFRTLVSFARLNNTIYPTKYLWLGARTDRFMPFKWALA